MGLFGNSSTDQSLVPNGLGQVFSAAQQSGLTGMAADSIAAGMKNEDQVALIYNLMATHPNQVALFLLSYPDFLKEFANLIGLIVRKEMFGLFKSGAIMTPTERGGSLVVNSDLAADYASITQENVDMQISKIVPLQQMQMEVSQADMRAMQMMNGHQQQMMMGNMQQQQMMQQQMMQQQMMQPQRQGMGAALGNFGSNLIRGSLGLPPTQAQPQMMGGGMMPQQTGMPMQGTMMPPQTGMGGV